MGKNVGKNINKRLSGKYNLGILAARLSISSKRVIQKTAETTGDMTGNDISNKITKASKN